MTDMTEDEYYGVAYRSSRTDMYYVRDPDLKCTWRQWNIVGPSAVAVFVDDGHCTDMTGAIRVATRLFPGVTEITVISGDALDIVYRREGDGAKWRAIDTRGSGITQYNFCERYCEHRLDRVIEAQDERSKER